MNVREVLSESDDYLDDIAERFIAAAEASPEVQKQVRKEAAAVIKTRNAAALEAEIDRELAGEETGPEQLEE